MLLRAAALYVLFVLASLAGVIAVWQSWEVRLRDSRLAESLSSEEALQVKLQAAIDTALSAERRARLAENTVEDLQHVQGAGNDDIDAMKANLAAAPKKIFKNVKQKSLKQQVEILKRIGNYFFVIAERIAWAVTAGIPSPLTVKVDLM